MSHPLAYKNDIPMKRSNTTKKAAPKRKTQKSQNVADLRETLTNAIGALVALDLLIERMMKDKR